MVVCHEGGRRVAGPYGYGSSPARCECQALTSRPPHPRGGHSRRRWSLLGLGGSRWDGSPVPPLGGEVHQRRPGDACELPRSHLGELDHWRASVFEEPPLRSTPSGRRSPGAGWRSGRRSYLPGRDERSEERSGRSRSRGGGRCRFVEAEGRSDATPDRSRSRPEGCGGIAFARQLDASADGSLGGVRPFAAQSVCLSAGGVRCLVLTAGLGGLDPAAQTCDQTS